MAAERKPFSETKFAQFLERAKPIMGKVLEGVGAVTGKDVFTNVGSVSSLLPVRRLTLFMNRRVIGAA